MNDPRRPEHVRSVRRGTKPTEQPRQPYPPHADPTYSGDSYYPPAYYPNRSPNPTETSPTEKLPQYWLQDQPPPDQQTQDGTPEQPKTPRWLWLAGAAAALLLVAALVIALVIANGVAKKQTAVPLLPVLPSSQIPAPTMSTSTPRTSSATTSHPSGTESSLPSNASAMQTVVYNVTGEGRAISITYVDNDGMTQTEFNIGLPWSKEVSLPKAGGKKPNVTIVNIGHDVTCSVTVDGVQVRQRTGAGLTRCDGTS
jgi:hypothetical protein